MGRTQWHYSNPLREWGASAAPSCYLPRESHFVLHAGVINRGPHSKLPQIELAYLSRSSIAICEMTFRLYNAPFPMVPSWNPRRGSYLTARRARLAINELLVIRTMSIHFPRERNIDVATIVSDTGPWSPRNIRHTCHAKDKCIMFFSTPLSTFFEDK